MAHVDSTANCKPLELNPLNMHIVYYIIPILHMLIADNKLLCCPSVGKCGKCFSAQLFWDNSQTTKLLTH